MLGLRKCRWGGRRVRLCGGDGVVEGERIRTEGGEDDV